MVSETRTIDTQLLRVFAAVAACRGITSAAKTLGIAKSAVSKQLVSLEKDLGVRLFERTSRRVLLTKEGRILLPRAESILAELDQFRMDALDEKASVRGVVTIAASPEFGTFLAQHFLPGLLKRYPALKVIMTLEYGFEDLLDPRIDMAFRIGNLTDERIIARHLGDFPRVLVCSPDYAINHSIKEPDALESSNCLLFSYQGREATWQLSSLSSPLRKINIAVRGNLTIQGFAAMRAAAVAGVGVARLPIFVAAPALIDRTLILLLPKWTPTPVPVHLAYRTGVSDIARIKVVIDAIMSEVPRLLKNLSNIDNLGV